MHSFNFNTPMKIHLNKYILQNYIKTVKQNFQIVKMVGI